MVIRQTACRIFRLSRPRTGFRDTRFGDLRSHSRSISPIRWRETPQRPDCHSAVFRRVYGGTRLAYARGMGSLIGASMALTGLLTLWIIVASSWFKLRRPETDQLLEDR